MQRSINSFFQRSHNMLSVLLNNRTKINLVLALLIFSEATLSFIPSSRDGGVSEEATGDVRKEVVEAKTGQAAAPLSTGSCSCEP